MNHVRDGEGGSQNQTILRMSYVEAPLCRTLLRLQQRVINQNWPSGAKGSPSLVIEALTEAFSRTAGSFYLDRK